SDWLNYNTGWWRGLNPDGGHRKWGYILWDNDATFDFYINYTGIPNTDADALPCNPEVLVNQPWSDPEGHITILNKLRENPEFNQYYITRQADLLNTAFSCETMLNYLDTIETILSPEMAQHADRWFGT
ncbi:CotH kinase family protein, partial [Bradyrhizobium sp. NBAIM08]|uniref:CotH kinase family protein n=1 Tax=Bradyrhizobium sp. NBAIM08 TaxID=2793815 RepID=UPI001CD6B151